MEQSPNISPHIMNGGTAQDIPVADSFAIMTIEKPIGLGLSEQKALEQLSKEAGTKYDPQLIKLFTQIILDND